MFAQVLLKEERVLDQFTIGHTRMELWVYEDERAHFIVRVQGTYKRVVCSSVGHTNEYMMGVFQLYAQEKGVR